MKNRSRKRRNDQWSGGYGHAGETRSRDPYTTSSRYAEQSRRYDDRDENNVYDRYDQRPRSTNNPYQDNERYFIHRGRARQKSRNDDEADLYVRQYGRAIDESQGQGVRYKSWTDDENADKAENYDGKRGSSIEGAYGRGEYQGDQYYGSSSRHSDRQGRRGYGTTNYNDGGDTYENYNDNRYSQNNYREEQYRNNRRRNRNKRSNDQSRSAGYF